MTLRDYQLAAIDRVRGAIAQGARRVVMVMPTGAGKTRTCGEIVRLAVERGHHALWLGHRRELVDQAYDTLESYGLTVGAICETASASPNPFAPVQVASVQTLLKRNKRPRADIIIADEAHHFCEAAERWNALLADYPDAHIIGATATPERGDGCGLRGTFDTLVTGATVRELTDRGFLVPCAIMRPPRPLKPGELAQHPVDAYRQHAAGRLAVVFARSVALANEYTEQFLAHGIPAKSVSDDTPAAERRLAIEAFRAGTIRVLVNVYVLVEGFDAPETSCCILARGAGSAGMYLQMCGRILRPAPGKKDAVLLDLRGVSYDHGEPIDDREYSLDGTGIRLKDPNSYCPVCGAPKEQGEPCASCGYAPSGEDTAKPDKVTGDPLVKFAKKRAESQDQRIATGVRWYREGVLGRGYREGWLKAKWLAVYAEPLSSSDMMAIRAEARRRVA